MCLPKEKKLTYTLPVSTKMVYEGYDYQEDFWTLVLGSEELQDRMSKKILFGKLDMSMDIVTDYTLATGQVSHIVTDLRLNSDGDMLMDFMALETYEGKRLQEYLDMAAPLFAYVVSRGRIIDGSIDPFSYEINCINIGYIRS